MTSSEMTPLNIGGTQIGLGERKTIELLVSRLYTRTEVFMRVHAVRGAHPGPTIFLSAALHGDELNGVEVIRRVLRMIDTEKLRGTVLAVPVVNAFGFISRSRYLPDRRDLNRCFPGSKNGSLASQMARIFMDEVVANSNYGIDFHTGAIHRANLPQIRANLQDTATRNLAYAFGTPVIIDAQTRDGSLRQAVSEFLPILLFEGGEALRFDEVAIRAGLNGALSVMRSLDMMDSNEDRDMDAKPYVANSSGWIRAPEAGVHRTISLLGRRVGKGERVGVISDPLGETEIEVLSPRDGIIIGQNNLPVVNRGDGLFHLASFNKLKKVESQVESFQTDLEDYEEFDSDFNHFY